MRRHKAGVGWGTPGWRSHEKDTLPESDADDDGRGEDGSESGKEVEVEVDSFFLLQK